MMNYTSDDHIPRRKDISVSSKRKFEKKIGIILLIIVVIIPFTSLMILFPLFFCANTYNDTAVDGNFTFAYGYYMGIHKMLGQNHAAVIEYEFDGEESNREITIPDSYNNITIRELGGALGRGVPAKFHIDYCDSPFEELMKEAKGHYRTTLENITETGIEFDEVIYDDFNLYLGKNIESIWTEQYNYLSVFELQDGKTVAHCMRFYVICDENNTHFFSKSGVLYNKDGTSFDSFIYVGQELDHVEKEQL